MKHFSAPDRHALTGGAQLSRPALHGPVLQYRIPARSLDFIVVKHVPSAAWPHHEGAVNCVVADSIQYVVSQPLIIDTITQNGFTLTMYEASLVGILIGGNTRPVAPPMRTYFVLDKRLGGVATLSGA